MSFHQKLVVYYTHTGLLWDFIHSGHKLCAYRIHIVGSMTFERVCVCENFCGTKVQLNYIFF